MSGSQQRHGAQQTEEQGGSAGEHPQANRGLDIGHEISPFRTLAEERWKGTDPSYAMTRGCVI
jgi:hypothetical protein